jgi:hypothetical protein
MAKTPTIEVLVAGYRELVEARAKIATLEAEIASLRPPPDPWQEQVEAWLRADGGDRFPTSFLLTVVAVGEEHQTVDDARRLARVMRALGWRPTTNVPWYEGRVRGWQKPR